MKRLTIALICALPLTMACSKKTEEPAEATPGPAAAVEAPEPVEADVPVPELAPVEPSTELGDLPTPEDLEEEAEKTLAVDNLELELDRLEAEILGYE